MQEPLVIYFEGLPGGGKTTLITNAAIDYPELFTAIPEYLNAQAALEASKAKNQTYFWSNDEDKYRAARGSRKIALVDRGHLSTVIYSRAYTLLKDNVLADTDEWYENTILANGMLPDLYVHLSVSPKTTFARRPKTLSWDNVWDYPEALTYARQELRRLIQVYEQVPILEIDADTLTIPEVQKKFIETLFSKYLPGKKPITKEVKV